jgi:hypothetical protein
METKSVESQSSGGPVKQRLKINKWAKTSFWCGLFALGLPIAILLFIDTLFFMTLPLSFSTKRILRAVFDQIIVVGSPVLAITALVSGVVKDYPKERYYKGSGQSYRWHFIELIVLCFCFIYGDVCEGSPQGS